MALDLLEREPFLCALDDALRQAAAGHGQFALVSGEAGIGKTTLVERFIEGCPPATRTLWGACEPLFTPRPLGPLYDVAQQTPTPLRALLDGDANRATLFAAVLDLLTPAPAPTPTILVLVLEDLHWADEATLDLVRFLVRRLHRTPALLIATYRDEELGRHHPLRLVLGDLPTRGVTRLRLPPLSEAAVATLAQQADRPAHALYLATGGNPFFLGEVLASDTPGVPASVSDAVLAKVARRSPATQRLLELVAVVPNRIEWRAVEAIHAAAGSPPDRAPDPNHDAASDPAAPPVPLSAALEECLAASLLHLEGNMVGYRHELARQAVESALSPARKRELHADVLRALLERGVEQTPLARLVHHAAQAEDGAQVLRFAPEAAKQASAQGAHREAAAHFAITLRYVEHSNVEQRAELLDGLSREHYLSGHFEDAVQPCEAAVAIWRALDQTERLGHALRQLSRLNWILGRNLEAAGHGMEAVELLETLPPGRELALAYANMSHLAMLASDSAQTRSWGTRAIELAGVLQDAETVCYVLNNIGSTEFANGDEGGRTKLKSSLQMALEHGYEEHAARAYHNLADGLLRSRDYPLAATCIQEGIAYCAARDLGSWELGLLGQRARVRLDQGDWAGADQDAAAVLNVPWAPGTNRIPALIVLGQLRVRRGDPGAEAALEEARSLAVAIHELNWLVAISATRAEQCWLHGQHEQCVAEAKVGVEQAPRYDQSCYLFESAFWLWRGGGLSEAPAGLPLSFALEIKGDWRAAAAEWERLGCPYEQALALMDGDEPAQRAALALFERLGAAPAAELVRRRLRTAGARGLPRGPRPATRANPHGLTPRQLEILLLLAEGLRNPEIAERLSTTPKTVEHHVSAVLAKLDARSRAEAVRVAYQQGLVPQPSPSRATNIGAR